MAFSSLENWTIEYEDIIYSDFGIRWFFKT